MESTNGVHQACIFVNTLYDIGYGDEDFATTDKNLMLESLPVSVVISNLETVPF